MRGSSCEIGPTAPHRRLAFLGPRGLVLGLGLALAGCATSSAGETSATRSYAGAARIEMEDDGLPAQVAPFAAIRNAPDDPGQPYSRNYGLRPPARLSGPPTHMSILEQEALIARAITEHEMRRP